VLNNRISVNGVRNRKSAIINRRLCVHALGVAIAIMLNNRVTLDDKMAVVGFHIAEIERNCEISKKLT
jgi:hypothetical protein